MVSGDTVSGSVSVPVPVPMSVSVSVYVTVSVSVGVGDTRECDGVRALRNVIGVCNQQ